jgi:glucokinase
MDLIADIGATNSRFALLDDKGKPLAAEEFHNADFTGFAQVLEAYLDHRRETDRPRQAALAIAAPIVSDRVTMVNIQWEFSQNELKRRFGLSRLVVVNDLAAVAWGLPDTKIPDVQLIGRGEPVARAPLAVLGPGSGLGVATIVASSDTWAVASGEGGHVTMAAADEEEAAVLRMLRERFGHCSAERLLSGPGLVNLYETLGRLASRPVASMSPADVTRAAELGDALAGKARDMFFAMLGTVAGNLALTVGARGGVYLAGGIVPRMVEPLELSGFRERFEAKGRYRYYMERIPTYVITERVPAFRGLRRLLGYH